MDGPFIGYRGGRAPKGRYKAFALGLVGDALPSEGKNHLLQLIPATGMLS